MHRGELVSAVARDTEHDRQVVEEVTDSFLWVVTLSLSLGEPVTIRNFGRFQTRLRPPSKLRNPRTGELFAVPARSTVVFSPAPRLKRRVNAHVS